MGSITKGSDPLKLEFYLCIKIFFYNILKLIIIYLLTMNIVDFIFIEIAKNGNFAFKNFNREHGRLGSISLSKSAFS